MRYIIDLNLRHDMDKEDKWNGGLGYYFYPVVDTQDLFASVIAEFRDIEDAEEYCYFKNEEN